ncbi:MAG: membrane lipoprotein lipid attachment site-containing protein [Alphaproteobacteria bacterium]
MKRIIFVVSFLLILSGCSDTALFDFSQYNRKVTYENPNDIYGILVKAEDGESDISCTQLRQGYRDAQRLAAKTDATVPELSLLGRYQTVVKRRRC